MKVDDDCALWAQFLRGSLLKSAALNLANAKRDPGAIEGSDRNFVPVHRSAELGVVLHLFGAGKRGHVRHVNNLVLEDNGHDDFVAPQAEEAH